MFRATASINSTVVLLLVALTFLPLHRVHRLRDQIANRIVISNPLLTSLSDAVLVFCHMRDTNGPTFAFCRLLKTPPFQTAVDARLVIATVSKRAACECCFVVQIAASY